MTDHTHDATQRSWVASAKAHAEFPLQNLPLGIFSPLSGGPRGGVAIGDAILDIEAALQAGLFGGASEGAATAAVGDTLNPLLALGAGPRMALRARLFELLCDDAPEPVRALAPRILHPAGECTLHLPARIGDYTDFYAGIQHANNVGRLLRPDAPLLPNYKYLPVGYHGRASSVRPSGEPVRRPNGQRKPGNEVRPSFGPSRNLDCELELGIWIGPRNELAEPIPIAEAHDHIAGYCLLNDWSARDIQGWEYQPLGPFLAKSFHTSISPWMVTPEALAPFRIPQPARPEGDPALMPYLSAGHDALHGGLDVQLEVLLLTPLMRDRGMDPHRLSAGNTSDLYWTGAQMIAHHTSGGCNLRAGDLLGSGTISGTEPASWGSLLEITQAGRMPVKLASGEERRFLEDGDEVTIRARAQRPGYTPIGFGDCRARVLPAPALA